MCKRVVVGGSEAVVDSFGECDGELLYGLSLVRENLSFDEASLGSMFRGGASSVAGSFVFDVADREPEELDHGVVVGEVSAVIRDFAELKVQRLDRVGRADHSVGVGQQREEMVWAAPRRSRTPLPRCGFSRPDSDAVNASIAVLAASAVGAY